MLLGVIGWMRRCDLVVVFVDILSGVYVQGLGRIDAMSVLRLIGRLIWGGVS